MVTSEFGVATQMSVLPSSRSGSMRAKAPAALWFTSPSTTCTLHVEQVPWVQAWGSHTPARRQASRMAWSARHSTVRPSGSTLMVYVSPMTYPPSTANVKWLDGILAPGAEIVKRLDDLFAVTIRA